MIILSHTNQYSLKIKIALEFSFTKNINWEIIPNLADERVRVIINIESSETKKPHFNIMRGAENELYNQEALRVMSLIPEWDVYYKLGEVYRMRWTQPIVFDEHTRKEYSH